MRVPVLAQWNDQAGDVKDVSGISRDISARGVFVVSSVQPPESAQVMVEVIIPSLTQGAKEMHLSSDGLVVRVEESDGALGYAVHCDFRTKLLARLSSIEERLI
jgi:hypothetical protein